MSFRNLVVAALAALALASCGGGPVKRVSPPTASVQELTVRADGSWQLRIRMQNFSNVPMTFNAIDAELEIADQKAGSLKMALDLYVPGESADVFEATLTPGAGVRPGNPDFAYRLHGTIRSSDPKGDFKFERKSRLTAAPGLVDTWR